MARASAAFIGTLLLVGLTLGSLGALHLSAPFVYPAPDPPAVSVAPVTPVGRYSYAGPPTISQEVYTTIWCTYGSAEACAEAPVMYDLLVAARIDPVVEALQAKRETTNGRFGVGRPGLRNAHGVQCHDSDQWRNGTTSMAGGNGCAGTYATYADSVRAWIDVIQTEYIDQGYVTVEQVIPKYAPVSENDTAGYIETLEAEIDAWRAARPEGGNP